MAHGWWLNNPPNFEPWELHFQFEFLREKSRNLLTNSFYTLSNEHSRSLTAYFLEISALCPGLLVPRCEMPLLRMIRKCAISWINHTVYFQVNKLSLTLTSDRIRMVKLLKLTQRSTLKSMCIDLGTKATGGKGWILLYYARLGSALPFTRAVLSSAVPSIHTVQYVNCREEKGWT